MLYISSAVYVKCCAAMESEAALCIFRGVRTVVGSQILLYFPTPTPLRRLSLSPPFVSKLQYILLLFKENIVSIAHSFSAWPNRRQAQATSTVGNSYRETVASLVLGVKLKRYNRVVWRGHREECWVGAPVGGKQNSSSTWGVRFSGIVLSWHFKFFFFSSYFN